MATNLLPVSGEFRIRIGGRDTAPLPHDATPEQVQAAIDALGPVGDGWIFYFGQQPIRVRGAHPEAPPRSDALERYHRADRAVMEAGEDPPDALLDALYDAWRGLTPEERAAEKARPPENAPTFGASPEEGADRHFARTGITLGKLVRPDGQPTGWTEGADTWTARCERCQPQITVEVQVMRRALDGLPRLRYVTQRALNEELLHALQSRGCEHIYGWREAEMAILEEATRG